MDKAREYAISALKEQIEQLEAAYTAGYKEALKSIPKPNIEDEMGTTFVDLGLNDGLMWSNENLHERISGGWKIGFPFYEALRYGLPTIEQYEYMFSRCKKEKRKFRSPNGSIIKLSSGNNNFNEFLWVKSDIVDDEALAYKITENEDPVLVRRFTGENALCLLVKPISEE